MAIEMQGFKFTGVYYNGSPTVRAVQYSAMQSRGTTYDLQVIEVATNGQAACGILQNTPLSGQAAEIMVSGMSKVICGVALAAGVVISPATNGKMFVATTGSAVCGQMVVGGTADGHIGSALISCAQVVLKV